MELLKLLSTSEIVAQVVNFLILLFLLRLFFWKRILKLLDDRRDRISSEFKKIEDTKKEVEGLRSSYQTELARIEEKTKEKIREAVEEGKEIADNIKKDAHEEAQKIIDSARQDIKSEMARAKEEIKGQIVDLTIKATENLISEKLTETDNKKLVEDFLNQVDKIE
jgi:F-type H+-transporting ATPase subunit b